MKERPILFNGAMVRAILERRKTQTRRPMKLKWQGADAREVCSMPSPFGERGDRLWVRETFAVLGDQDKFVAHYKADRDDWNEGCGWKPSLHMPRWASRITLEITGVGVQRLQDISEEEATAEGFPAMTYALGEDADTEVAHYWKGESRPSARAHFAGEWNQIYPDSWAKNPWVWVIETKLVT